MIRAHEDAWKDTYVYFKHEEAGKGPEFARRSLEWLAESRAGLQ